MKINKIRPKFHFLTKIEIKMTYLVFLFCFLPPQSVGRQWSLSNELLRATKGARKLFLVSNISLTV